MRIPILESLRQAVLTPARKERLAYFQSIPLSRLLVFVGAGFFLFVAIRLLSELDSNGQKHLMAGFVLAAYSGVMAACYTLAAARKRILILALALVQILGDPGLQPFISWLGRIHADPAVPFERAVAVFIPWSIGLIAVSYLLFLRFIRIEGRFAFRAHTELTLAQGIQQTLVPVVDVASSSWEIYGISVPSDKVGGDLVDAVSLPDGSAVAYLADISGHGLQAGILMGMLKTAVRTSLIDSPGLAPLFKTLNRVLPQVKESHMYATCAALHLHPGKIEFALAGHPPILHLSADGKRLDRLSDEQFPIGLFPFATYRSQSVQAAKGDLFVIATDGILEVSGKDGIEFGGPALEKVLTANAGLSLRALAQKILDGAKAAGPQDDDQTLLLIRLA